MPYGPERWAAGRIVALYYREDDWPVGQVAPYQVELEDVFNPELIFVPMDDDRVVRRAEQVGEGRWMGRVEAAGGGDDIDILGAQLEQRRRRRCDREWECYCRWRRDRGGVLVLICRSMYRAFFAKIFARFASLLSPTPPPPTDLLFFSFLFSSLITFRSALTLSIASGVFFACSSVTFASSSAVVAAAFAICCACSTRLPNASCMRAKAL